jgi:hypothetical protein
LIIDVLKYGEAAQNFKGYNVEDSVAAGLTAEQRARGSKFAASNNMEVEFNGAHGVTVKSATVFYSNVVKIRFYFTVTEGVELGKLHILLNNAVVTPVYDSNYGMYYVETAAISATAFYNAQTLLISANGSFANMLSVSYDVNTYAYNRAKKATDETEVALVKALYAYGRSAEMFAAK